MGRRGGEYEIDMINGAILPKVLRFAVPLMLSSILQLLFNAADVVVVGRFEGDLALAAVGSTGSLVSLLVNLFLGFSIGANIIVARYYGSQDYRKTSDAVHTSIASSLLCGLLLTAVGVTCCGQFLKWMDSPAEVLPLATLYMRIYFIGMPVNMLYNFGAAVLRSVGDTRRPLYYLTLSGVVNVVLNLIFVIIFHMGVAGVALATIASQAISAILVFLALLHYNGPIRLFISKLRINKQCFADIMKVGFPAGLQGTFFAISNVLIQSTVNSFGATVVAGNSVAANLESFIYVAMNAIAQASTTFTSQNVGAGKNERLWPICRITVLTVSVIGIIIGGILYLFHTPLYNIYTQSPDVVLAAENRMIIIETTYWVCGVMEVLCGCLRGIGSTIAPMIISVCGACVFRVFWVACIVPLHKTQFVLYVGYPISWVLTSLVHFLFFCIFMRKFPATKPDTAVQR